MQKWQGEHNPELEAHKYDHYSAATSLALKEENLAETQEVVEVDWSKVDSGALDFGIEVIEDSEKASTISIPKCPKEPETLLFNSKTRQRILNDLEELSSFLLARQLEHDSKEAALFDAYTQQPSRGQEEQVPHFRQQIDQITLRISQTLPMI